MKNREAAFRPKEWSKIELKEAQERLNRLAKIRLEGERINKLKEAVETFVHTLDNDQKQSKHIRDFYKQQKSKEEEQKVIKAMKHEDQRFSFRPNIAPLDIVMPEYFSRVQTYHPNLLPRKIVPRPASVPKQTNAQHELHSVWSLYSDTQSKLEQNPKNKLDKQYFKSTSNESTAKQTPLQSKAHTPKKDKHPVGPIKPESKAIA